MTLVGTIPLMLSNDYKDRLRAEYCQLIIRIKNLEERLEQLRGICPTDEYDQLYTQRAFMKCYKITLERRTDKYGKRILLEE